jgi:hypothetical protein
MEDFVRGHVEDLKHTGKRGRPVDDGSYLQRFTAVMDTLDVLDYVEVPEEKVKQTRNLVWSRNKVGDKKFVTVSEEGGRIRVFRVEF